jgi:hypothetical protein
MAPRAGLGHADTASAQLRTASTGPFAAQEASSMSSTYRITAVRVETTAANPHEHIARVRIGFDGGTGLSRETLISQLNDPHGDRYDAFANGELADVILQKCPACTAKDHITTRSRYTTANNLLELPRY